MTRKDDLLESEVRKLMFHPENNPNVISIIKMPDGNYRGFMQKNGQLIQERQSDPGIVLQMLLTSSGTKTKDVYEMAEDAAENAAQAAEDNEA